MIWYKACRGSWRDPEGVKVVSFGSDRGKVFREAQKAANEAGKMVTVSAEWPSARGLEFRYFDVAPESGN